MVEFTKEMKGNLLTKIKHGYFRKCLSENDTFSKDEIDYMLDKMLWMLGDSR